MIGAFTTQDPAAMPTVFKFIKIINYNQQLSHKGNQFNLPMMFASGDAKFITTLHAIIVFRPRRLFVQLFQQPEKSIKFIINRLMLNQIIYLPDE